MRPVRPFSIIPAINPTSGLHSAEVEQFKSEFKVHLVNGETLEELWSNAYFVVQPSVLEGLSIALLEALSFGKCVLVSDIPENLEVVEDCAVSFRSRDVDHLHTQMEHLLQSPELVGSFEEQCRALIRENYSWDVVVDALERLYEKTSGQASARPGSPVAKPDLPGRRSTVRP